MELHLHRKETDSRNLVKTNGRENGHGGRASEKREGVIKGKAK